MKKKNLSTVSGNHQKVKNQKNKLYKKNKKSKKNKKIPLLLLNKKTQMISMNLPKIRTSWPTFQNMSIQKITTLYYQTKT